MILHSDRSIGSPAIRGYTWDPADSVFVRLGSIGAALLGLFGIQVGNTNLLAMLIGAIAVLAGVSIAWRTLSGAWR